MKNNLTILLLMLSITTLAQFPAPTNFEFSYEYIMIDQSGYCAGQWVYGPTYCSHFNWTAPDTTTTQATLDYYNLYYNAYLYNDTILYLFASTTDTFYDVEAGFIGEMWVTAVYSNPNGESDSSNMVINYDLPISVEENGLTEEFMILYDRKSQLISIKNGDRISKIRIIDIQGKLLKSLNFSNNKISLENLPTGLYIIEIFTDNSEVIRQKILK